jgi:hypothetical protein
MSSIAVTTLSRSPVAAGLVPEAGRADLAHLPGDDGLPLVGDTFAFLADSLKVIAEKSRRYGLVYRTRGFGQRMIALLGPDAMGFMLSDQTKLFSLGARP